MRKIIVTCAATVLLAAGVLSHAQTKGKAAPKMSPAPTYGNTDAISEDELKVYDFFLASDQLEGRNFPSRGYDTAALTARRDGLHVVVTGRNAKPELVAAADLVTEMTLVKHHFAAGVKAQPGIEF